MGTYTSDLVIGAAFPTVLPQFCLLIRYFEQPEDASEPLELRVFVPGDAEDSPTHKTIIPGGRTSRPPLSSSVPPEPGARNVLTFVMKMSPFLVHAEGRIKVRMVKGDQIFRLGSLRVISRPSGPDADPIARGPEAN